MGRKDDILQLPDGKMLSGNAIANILLRPFKEINEFCIIQESLNDFVLKIVFFKKPKNEVLLEIQKSMGNAGKSG